MPGEDETQFRQIEDQFIRDFRPEDMAEIAMARDLAVLAWKKIRLENLELRFTLSRLNEPLGFLDKHETKFLSSHRVESNLNRLTSFTDELRGKAVLAKACAERLKVKGATIEDLEGLDQSYPLIHQKLVEYIIHYKFTNPTAKNVLCYEIENDDGETSSFGIIS